MGVSKVLQLDFGSNVSISGLTIPTFFDEGKLKP